MPKKTSNPKTPPASKPTASNGATVSRLMTQPVHRVDASASLNDACRLMWDHAIGAVPVVDNQDRLIGIVTDRDIAMAAYLQGRVLRDISVQDVMSRTVESARSDEPIVRASSTMARRQIRRLPVQDSAGTLVGMLSLDDLAQASADPESSGITEHDVADTLRAVGAPRAT